MNFNYSQVFLLVWVIAFWIGYFLTYGKVEAKHEKSMREKYGKSKWGPFVGIVFFGWMILTLIYIFHYNSVNWFWKISSLDYDFVKIIAIIIMCFAFLLNILFTMSVAKAVDVGVKKGEKPKLVTTGIYRYTRHPGWLALDLVMLGTFLIIPSILTLIFLFYTIVVMHGKSLEEEKTLTKIYGREYEKYRKNVGRFLPKIKGYL